jgi:hypothetical protein
MEAGLHLMLQDGRLLLQGVVLLDQSKDLLRTRP